VTEVKTEVVYLSPSKPSSPAQWARKWASKILNSRESSGCGPGLLSCDVKDPTRAEAPWHGVAAAFPQCYDPAAYVCSENFLCPFGAPKIQGQYACDPYLNTLSTSSAGNPVLSSNTVPPQPASTGNDCGPGTLLCEVQDPTRLEPPWHGVSAPFPQCYDPSLYICAENFLCPICAPKIPGQYACGPYTSPCPLPSATGSTASTTYTASTSSSKGVSKMSSISLPGNSSSLSSTSSTTTMSSNTQSLQVTNSSSSQQSTFSGSVTTVLPTTETLPNGSLTTISGTTETISTSTLQISVPGGIVIGGSTIPFPTSLEVVTEPDGEVITLGPSGIIVGSDTISFPSLTAPTTLTSDGLTFTLEPPATNTRPVTSTNSNSAPEIVIDGNTFTIGTGFHTITEADGSSLVIGPSNIVVGTDTIPFPPAGATLTTDGITIGERSTPIARPTSEIVLDGSTFTIGTGFQTFTEPDGSTVVIGPSNIVVGTHTIPFPSAGATITTDGITIGEISTLKASPTSEIVLDGSTFTIGTGFQTITEPRGSNIIIGPSNIVVGSDTIPFPPPGATLTTDGITLGEVTAAPSSTLSTSNPPTSTGPLPIFSTWPPGITVSTDDTEPVTTGTATTGTHIYV
jgi:hypothetical protein